MNFVADGSASSIEPGATASFPSGDTTKSLETLDRVVAEVRRAAAMTEGTFVGIGQRLEASITTIDGLTGTFKTLMEELGGAELVQATADLSRVSNRITALAQEPRDGEQVLGRITELTTAMSGRLDRMRKAVKVVDVLAVNAKIASAHIGTGGEGFSTFAEEIARAMKVAEENLDRFSEQLDGMSQALYAAMTGQRDLGAQRDEAIRAIPEQLARSVSAIEARRSQAEGTAAEIGRKMQQVGQRVGSAVMSMQIGDTTRQRIEHADFALSLIASLFGHSSSAGIDLDFGTVTEEEKRRLAGAVCALTLAQLADMAQELNGQAGEIAASLEQLAGDAKEIAVLGQRTYASGGYRPGSFLSDLEQDVGQARTLLEDLRNAQTTGDDVMANVLDTTKALVGNISAIQSLEADIRLMGLNTTLRCGRLGSEGRALTVIAQELRTCSNLTATEAEAVLTDLDEMVAAAGSSSNADAERRLAEVTDMSALMIASVELLSGTANALAGALETLDRESGAVATALNETAAEIRAKAEIGQMLRQASDSLQAVQKVFPFEDEVADPAGLLAAIAGKYTMAREREVHARVLKTELPPAPEAATADDDIFF